MTANNPAFAQMGIRKETLATLTQQRQVADAQRQQILSNKTSGPANLAGNQIQNMAGPSSHISARSVRSAPPPPADNAKVPMTDWQRCEYANGAPVILSVNGQKSGAVFTPIKGLNLFTLKGCNFGDLQGSMHLYGGFNQGQLGFQIEFWNDSSIIAMMQPVSKELDQDKTQLVLVLGNGHQYQFSGYKFYAARETKLLTAVPKNQGQLAQGLKLSETPFIYTPNGNYSLGVLRRSHGNPGGGTDSFGVDGLLAGYVPVKVDLLVGPGNTPNNGWSTSFSSQGVEVKFVFVHDPDNLETDFFVSSYALDIWVSGPQGFDSPWQSNPNP